MSFNKFLDEKLVTTGPENLDIDRSTMPQMTSPRKFLKFLEQDGVVITRVLMEISNIKSTQKKIDTDKVDSILDSDTPIDCSNFILSKDNYILDGHHRLHALKITDHQTIEVHHTSIDMPDLLERAQNYLKSEK